MTWKLLFAAGYGGLFFRVSHDLTHTHLWESILYAIAAGWIAWQAVRPKGDA